MSARAEAETRSGGGGFGARGAGTVGRPGGERGRQVGPGRSAGHAGPRGRKREGRPDYGFKDSNNFQMVLDSNLSGI